MPVSTTYWLWITVKKNKFQITIRLQLNTNSYIDSVDKNKWKQCFKNCIMHNNHLLNSAIWAPLPPRFWFSKFGALNYASYLKAIGSVDSKVGNPTPNRNQVEMFWKSTKSGLSISSIFSYYLIFNVTQVTMTWNHRNSEFIYWDIYTLHHCWWKIWRISMLLFND